MIKTVMLQTMQAEKLRAIIIFLQLYWKHSKTVLMGIKQLYLGVPDDGYKQCDTIKDASMIFFLLTTLKACSCVLSAWLA